MATAEVVEAARKMGTGMEKAAAAREAERTEVRVEAEMAAVMEAAAMKAAAEEDLAAVATVAEG